MEVLGQSKPKATIYFAVAAITGPVAGVLLGGYTYGRIGGYNSPKAYPLSVMAMGLGSLVGFPLPFVENHLLSTFLVWF